MGQVALLTGDAMAKVVPYAGEAVAKVALLTDADSMRKIALTENAIDN